MISSVTTTQLTIVHATGRYQNFDRKQVEESTSRFLLLIDNSLQIKWHISQSISPS